METNNNPFPVSCASKKERRRFVFLVIICTWWGNTDNTHICHLHVHMSLCQCLNINSVESFMCVFASTENNTNASHCTLCSLLQSCISFVMKSVARANFKLISPTQRTPITGDAKRAEANSKISVDNTALHLRLIMCFRLFCCCCCYRFGVNRSALLLSVVL